MPGHDEFVVTCRWVNDGDLPAGTPTTVRGLTAKWSSGTGHTPETLGYLRLGFQNFGSGFQWRVQSNLGGTGGYHKVFADTPDGYAYLDSLSREDATSFTGRLDWRWTMTVRPLRAVGSANMTVLAHLGMYDGEGELIGELSNEYTQPGFYYNPRHLLLAADPPRVWTGSAFLAMFDWYVGLQTPLEHRPLAATPQIEAGQDVGSWPGYLGDTDGHERIGLLSLTDGPIAANTVTGYQIIARRVLGPADDVTIYRRPVTGGAWAATDTLDDTPQGCRILPIGSGAERGARDSILYPLSSDHGLSWKTGYPLRAIGLAGWPTDDLRAVSPDGLALGLTMPNTVGDYLEKIGVYVTDESLRQTNLGPLREEGEEAVVAGPWGDRRPDGRFVVGWFIAGQYREAVSDQIGSPDSWSIATAELPEPYEGDLLACHYWRGRDGTQAVAGYLWDAGEIVVLHRAGWGAAWSAPVTVDSILPAAVPYLVELPGGRWECGWYADGEWVYYQAAGPGGTWTEVA